MMTVSTWQTKPFCCWHASLLALSTCNAWLVLCQPAMLTFMAILYKACTVYRPQTQLKPI